MSELVENTIQEAIAPKKIEHGFNLLSEIQQSIVFADSKANFIISIDLVLLGVVITIISNSIPIIKNLFNGTFEGGVWLAIYTFIAVIALFLVTCSIWNAINCVRPNTKNLSKKSSVVFFGSIASLTLEDFVTKFTLISDPEMLNNLIYQIHDKSLVAENKFDHIKSAINFLLFSLIFVVLLPVINLTISIIFTK
jgi:hypothetical protein